MEPTFDFARILSRRTEFIIGNGTGRTPTLSLVPVDQSVRTTLDKAAIVTWEAMSKGVSLHYDPSNAYPPPLSVFATHDELPVVKPKYLHEPINLPEPDDLEKDLLSADIYLARLFDQAGNRVTAVKKIRGMGKSLERKPLAVLRGGALSVDNEQKFEIEDSFDFFIDDKGIYAHKVVAFEGVCQLEKALKASAVANLTHVQNLIPFVDFSPIQSLLCNSVSSARIIAAIKAKGHADNLDHQKLLQKCVAAGIRHRSDSGRIIVEDDSADRFIRLIGKKILESDLKTTGVEIFSVSSSESLN